MKIRHFVTFITLIFLSSVYYCFAYQKLISSQNYRTFGTLNDRCTLTEDCGTYGYVCAIWNRSCQCLDQYLPDYKTKNCLGGVDQRCKYDEHCIEGAFCRKQWSCQCKETHPYASRDGMVCSGSYGLRTTFLKTTIFILVFNIIT